MIASYHNHTTWSDGQASIEMMIAAAGAQGLDVVGLSDHYVSPPPGLSVPKWSMPPDAVREYVAAVRAAAPPRGPVIRVGLEVDWFPGRRAALAAGLAALDVDYLIGAVHHVGAFEVDGAPSSWTRMAPAERERTHRRYWTRLRSLAESGLFDIVAHLDLTKKSGYPPQEPIDDLVAPTLDAIATAGLVVELNTAGWHKPIGDAYPDVLLLAECRRRDIPVTLSADAHRPQDLLRDFERGAARLRAAGYEKIARFTQRRVTSDPL